MGFDPTEVQSQSQDAIINNKLGGNFGVRRNFGLHRAENEGLCVVFCLAFAQMTDMNWIHALWDTFKDFNIQACWEALSDLSSQVKS